MQSAKEKKQKVEEIKIEQPDGLKTNQSSVTDAEIAVMPKVNNVQLVEQNVTTATNMVISAKFANLKRKRTS